jgi:hypothetical protein
MGLLVFNCKQGDSMLLHPDGGCVWSEIPLLIDTGPRSFTGFTATLNNFSEIDLLLTHSHDDHIGGIANISINIRTLYLPAYFPEIVKIASFFVQKFPQNKNAAALHILSKLHVKDIELLYENGNFGCCNHVQILNPPIDARIALNYEIQLNDEVLRRVDDFSLEIFGVGPNQINETRAFPDSEFTLPPNYNGRNFIYIFLDLMRSYFRRSRNAEDSFNKVIAYDANKISVVFKYENASQLDILFTGDADKSVFNRLIKDGSLPTSEILKVPHHGSRHNLSPKILKVIAPQIALVSHDNGKFGRAVDPHPNLQTIQWLNHSCRIHNVYYTNDVWKQGSILAGRHTGPINNYQIQFI